MCSGKLQILDQNDFVHNINKSNIVIFSNTGLDNTQVIIRSKCRTNQAAAQVLQQILLLTAASFAQYV